MGSNKINSVKARIKLNFALLRSKMALISRNVFIFISFFAGIITIAVGLISISEHVSKNTTPTFSAEETRKAFADKLNKATFSLSKFNSFCREYGSLSIEKKKKIGFYEKRNDYNEALAKALENLNHSAQNSYDYFHLDAHDASYCFVKKHWERTRKSDPCDVYLQSDDELAAQQVMINDAYKKLKDNNNPNRKMTHTQWDKQLNCE